jgi:penicillin-binding protein 2
VPERAIGTQRAAVVAIDPRNGDILAYVSTPTFDPNGFARGLTVPEYRAMADSLDKPLIDRALRGVYPPGSTIKPLIALAALEYGVTSPRARASAGAPGSFRIRATSTATGNGAATARSTCSQAIAQSCDVYFYGISDQIGIDRMHDFLVQFGLGEKTGIDLLGERSALVPSRAWKKTAFKKKEMQVWFPARP